MKVLFSEDLPHVDWSEAKRRAPEYGVKGASALAIPRAWTPPFALIPVDLIGSISVEVRLSSLITQTDLVRIRELGNGHHIILRSSVVGESIWERGSYLSLSLDTAIREFFELFDQTAWNVVSSVPPKISGLMIQRFISSASRGEFGNLQRISKTREQWEISASDRAGSTTNLRLNSQRDAAADPALPILARSGITQERLFGPIGAWLNNELLRGKSQRLTCEWLTDNRHFYLVQIDEEDEDLWGVNPFQLRVLPSPSPAAMEGKYFKLGGGDALQEWDKLKVLEELWEDGALHKPVLFYARLSDLPTAADAPALTDLEKDFCELFGPSGIVVRTSGAASHPKIPNLPRTECLTPLGAVEWCIETAAELGVDHELSDLAFVAHRFVAARAAAWVRADPKNPIVEIHSLWGLPDALQYCPYDIWEVHVPTGVATDYPEYKSDMLIATDDGGWKHERVKNEVARSNSINSTEAREVAARSLAIADRLGRACHIMWFVGCADGDGTSFNMPWYWTEAHEAEHNIDRGTFSAIIVKDQESLERFSGWEGPRTRQALVLKPTDLNLMRDTKFIKRVGQAAKAANVPVVLSGSTLAHAYYQLRIAGCAVVTPTRKERSRIRRTANLGKLVRDKIPTRIAERREFELTRQIPVNLMKGFLISKLLEEALEVREAVGPDQQREELADLYEVVRALAKSDGFDVVEIEQAADRKRERVGGFEQGLILLQTGITAQERSSLGDADRSIGQVLADQTSDDTIELPFSFFGFTEFDQPRSILFEHLGVRVDVSLRNDRIELHIVRSSEQLGLALDAPMTGLV